MKTVSICYSLGRSRWNTFRSLCGAKNCFFPNSNSHNGQGIWENAQGYHPSNSADLHWGGSSSEHNLTSHPAGREKISQYGAFSLARPTFCKWWLCNSWDHRLHCPCLWQGAHLLTGYSVRWAFTVEALDATARGLQWSDIMVRSWDCVMAPLRLHHGHAAAAASSRRD